VYRVKDAKAKPPTEGTIVIRWKRLPRQQEESFGFRFVWKFEPDPPLPDDWASEILSEVARRL
jgi:hypothetical protein